MYIVVIEWDGDKPPTTFYNRMHALGLHVQGSKDLSPLERRSRDDGSVVIQEGVVLCSSESLAHEIGLLADTLGAEVVKIGAVEPIKFEASEADVAVHRKIESVFSRRGRPIGSPENEWVVTCFEEGVTRDISREARNIVNCPICSGLNIRARVGTQIALRPDDSVDALEFWARSRFVSGEFEVPEISDAAVDEIDPRIPAALSNGRENDALSRIRTSSTLKAQIGKVSRRRALRLLDAVFAALAHLPGDTVLQSRINAIVGLYSEGIPPADLGILAKEVDVLHSSAVLGSRAAAEIWKIVR